MEINRFDGEYRFLSNFYEAPVVFEGMAYPSNEAAFQAAKCLNMKEREPFTAMPPSEAKRRGRRVALRPDWEEVKLGIMKAIVLDKFTRNPELKAKLLATGDARLAEGNSWRDRFWGVDAATGHGKNHLGLILMEVREELRENGQSEQLSTQNNVFLEGEMITRPAGEWSPGVHRLLRFMRGRGIPAPEPQGISDGKETLEFVPGEFVHPQKWTDEGLFAAGEFVAKLHKAGAAFSPSPEDRWQPWYLREIGKNPIVYSHGDIAPWNMVTEKGMPKALIDWEYAGPIDPMVELSRVCWLFPQLVDDDLAALYDLPSPEKRGRQVGIICDGYGLPREKRQALFDQILETIICETAHEAIDPGLDFDSQGPLWGFAWRTRSLYWIWRNRKALEKGLAIR